jgi:hypothetical protein
MDASHASYYIKIKITKIKVAEWGTPKKIFKIKPLLLFIWNMSHKLKKRELLQKLYLLNYF